MRVITCCGLVLTLAPQAWATPLPPTPTDAQGNRARSAFAPTASSEQLPAGPAASWQPFGPTGADSRAIAASPTAANVRIAGVSDSFGGGGLYRTADDGMFWQLVPETGPRGVNDVAFAVNGHAYAATQDGLFKSTDDGQTWTELTLPGNPDFVLAMAVATDPVNPQVVWVGLGQFSGGTETDLVLKSTNGGATWTDASPNFANGMGVTTLAIDPANPLHLAVAFSGDFGFGNQIWITSNGGATWLERSTGIPDNIIWDFAFASSTIYVTGGQDFGSQYVGLYKTVNNGLSWTQVSDAGWPSLSVTAVAVDPNNTQKIFVGTQRAGLGVSTNGGTSWTFSAGGTGELPVNDIAFVQNQSNNIFLSMGSVAVLHSTNGGTTFESAASGMNRLNVTSIAVNPLNSNEIAFAFAGDNNGGMFHSTDAGVTWILDQQVPLPRWQFLTFGPDGILYATHDGPLGRADDGVWVRQSNGSWQNIGPGTPSALDTLGRAIAVSSGTPKVILLGGTEGFFSGSDAVIHTYNRAGTGQWEKSYESGVVQSEYISSLTWLDGAGPAAVASVVNFGFENGGAGGILRSTNTGATWNRSESGYPSGWHAWGISSRPAQPNTLYTAASEFTFSDMNNRIYKSTDGGVSWSDQSFSDTPPFRHMIVDPELSGVMYGANLNNGRVLRSENDGGSFSLFSDGLIGQGGPAVLTTGGSLRRLYYGTTTGAFVTDLQCAADFDGDGFITGIDYDLYVGAFESGNSDADFDGDGFITGIDFDLYVGAFEAGC